MTQMYKPINLSWFAGTTGMFPHRLPFYNPRPDPTPECPSADRALRWFQENIRDAPLDPDASDLRLLKKMSALHSAVLRPSDSNDAKKAFQDLLEENILTDEKSDQDETEVERLLMRARWVLLEGLLTRTIQLQVVTSSSQISLRLLLLCLSNNLRTQR